MKIAIIDAHDKDYESVAQLCFPSKIKYCAKHNYDFHSYLFDKLPKGYGPTWGRVIAIKKYIKQYDWILYLDTDTIITNPTIKIEDYINEYPISIGRMPDHDTGKPTHLSTSAMLIKNCAWTYGFLSLWYKQKKFDTEPYHADNAHKHLSTWGHGGLYFEQSALHYLYDTEENVRENIHIMPNSWFNHREVNHDPSQFLIHFARSPKIQRIKQFLLCTVKLL